MFLVSSGNRGPWRGPERGIDQSSLGAVLTPAGRLRFAAASKFASKANFSNGGFESCHRSPPSKQKRHPDGCLFCLDGGGGSPKRDRIPEIPGNPTLEKNSASDCLGRRQSGQGLSPGISLKTGNLQGKTSIPSLFSAGSPPYRSVFIEISR